MRKIAGLGEHASHSQEEEIETQKEFVCPQILILFLSHPEANLV